jgi:competence protein ComEA
VDRVRSIFGSRVWAAILSGSLLGLLVLAVVMIFRGDRGETIVLQVQPVTDPNVVRVYVGGEVVSPGLYTLPRGSRVAEAIETAGGTTTAGDVAGFGMAAVVEDADQIIVPARQAITTPPPIVPFAGTGVTATAAPSTSSTSPTVTNVNTASATELEALPGIGPALAARIITYRETNGPLQTVDELEAIDGISQRMVDEMRHLITVGS